MAEIDHRPPNIQLHPARFLGAAAASTGVYVLTLAVDVVAPDFDIHSGILGALRAVCALLWVFWFLVYLADRFLQSVSPEAAAYAAGYVDGVARRFPAEDDRVRYLKR